jgi:two-component system cell cycle sensor histidine kinase/response regulator CckA
LGRGTGLGLSTVYGIIKQSGGYIYLISAENQGSTFTVYLPEYSGAADESSPEPVSLASGRGTILVVEDESMLRTTIADFLQKSGYTVWEAADAFEALKIDTAPDVVVSDVRMPGITGQELALRLRERFPAISIILMSGYSDLPELSAIPDARFLQKPVSMRRLQQELTSCMESRSG